MDTKRFGPRYRACPQCGDVRWLDNTKESDTCRRCAGAGHLFRMMTVEEMAASVEQNERDGFYFVATKRALIRDKLLHAESI